MRELLDMSMAHMQRTIKIMKYPYKIQQCFTCFETWIISSTFHLPVWMGILQCHRSSKHSSHPYLVLALFCIAHTRKRMHMHLRAWSLPWKSHTQGM